MTSQQQGASAAVHGSHLAAERVQSTGSQPSIFDVLSQESLMSSLKPAFGHLVKYLATINPERWSQLYRFYDECYAAFDLLLQNYCLKNYGASFAENFYNMKRVLTNGDGMPTDGAQRARSLIFLVLVPYAREKLDKLHERWAELYENRPKSKSPSFGEKLGRAFIAAYPWIKSALDLWTFVLQFLYLISKSDVHSPFLKFAGVHLETLTPADLAKMGAVVDSGIADAGFMWRIWRMFTMLPRVMFSAFSKALGFGLFFMQFLDFWYSNEQTRELSLNTLPKPPPPHQLVPESSVLALEPGSCPICKRKRTNDAVLSVSGYVFCYACIIERLKSDRRCPVTGLPAGPENLIRVFGQQIS